MLGLCCTLACMIKAFFLWVKSRVWITRAACKWSLSSWGWLKTKTSKNIKNAAGLKFGSSGSPLPDTNHSATTYLTVGQSPFPMFSCLQQMSDCYHSWVTTLWLWLRYLLISSVRMTCPSLFLFPTITSSFPIFVCSLIPEVYFLSLHIIPNMFLSFYSVHLPNLLSKSFMRWQVSETHKRNGRIHWMYTFLWRKSDRLIFMIAIYKPKTFYSISIFFLSWVCNNCLYLDM